MAQNKSDTTNLFTIAPEKPLEATVFKTDLLLNQNQGDEKQKSGIRFIPLFGRYGKKHNNLDFIRFFLATIVIWCHCYVIYYGTEETVEPLWVFSNRQMSIGTFAVNFFFILSGYLIVQSWENSANAWQYFKKRILRIYPGFIVVSFLCVFIIGPFGTADYFQPYGYWKEYYQKINYTSVILNAIFLEEVKVPWSFINIPMSNIINGSLWPTG